MKKGDVAAIVFCVFVVASLFALMASCTPTWQWHAEAIKNGAAQYNPTTGRFEWKPQRAEAGESK